MSWYNKIAWSDGVLLRTPQFQQQERYLEHYAHKRAAPLSPFFFRVQPVRPRYRGARARQVIVKSVAGVFSDGTPFDAPGSTPPPSPLTIRPEHLDQVIYLAVPVRVPTARRRPLNEASDSLARYSVFDVELRGHEFDWHWSPGHPAIEGATAARFGEGVDRRLDRVGADAREDHPCRRQYRTGRHVGTAGGGLWRERPAHQLARENPRSHTPARECACTAP